MIELFEQRMKELLKDDYNAFKDASTLILKMPIIMIMKIIL